MVTGNTDASVPAKNTDPPGVRCGMCGGPARVWKPGGWRDFARWIECAGPCAWSEHSPRRASPWWEFRVRLAAYNEPEVTP